MTGWVKLHRSIQDHWLFSFKQPDKALAWIDLVVSASFEAHTIMIKGKPLKLERGDVSMSQLTLQKRWGWSQNKVKRFLKVLKNDRMIDYKTNDLTTIIKVLNYGAYQGQGTEKEIKTNDHTNDHTNDLSNEQADDIQEGKKVKKVKKDYSDAFLSFWNEWGIKRKGDSKFKASQTFENFIKNGVPFERILSSLTREKFDPEFIPYIKSWLNKRMWENDDGEVIDCKWTNLLKYYKKEKYWSADNGPTPIINGIINPECLAPPETIKKVLGLGELI